MGNVRGWEVEGKGEVDWKEVQNVKSQEGDMSLQLDIVMLVAVGAE